MVGNSLHQTRLISVKQQQVHYKATISLYLIIHFLIYAM